MKVPIILGGIALLVMAGIGLTLLDQPSPQENVPQDSVNAQSQVAQPVTDLRTQKVQELLDGMSDEELVGQLFFARCPDGNEAERAMEYHLGGYILFGRDFVNRTPDTLREMLAGCQAGSKIPMLLGVDEEGGTVVRASYYPQYRESRFQSPQRLYLRGGIDAIIADAQDKAGFLKDLGLNINLAPVCDVSTSKSDYIYARALGEDAETTAVYVRAVVQETQQFGIGCVLKHFPGYGNNADTHTGIAIDRRSLITFRKSDFLPFQAGIEAGAGCILVSHNIVEAMDSQNPASLSPAVHALLRQELGFSGVILTDDLSMDAIGQLDTSTHPAVRALQAGNDMLIVSDFEVAYQAVLSAMQDGVLEKEAIQQAVTRVLNWKYDLGLL